MIDLNIHEHTGIMPGMVYKYIKKLRKTVCDTVSFTIPNIILLLIDYIIN